MERISILYTELKKDIEKKADAQKNKLKESQNKVKRLAALRDAEENALKKGCRESDLKNAIQEYIAENARYSAFRDILNDINSLEVLY